MEKYKINYLKAFGYDATDFIPCEICDNRSIDIHHIEPKSSFGSKEKDAQDHSSNLIALCRECHNIAHGPESRRFKEVLKRIVLKR